MPLSNVISVNTRLSIGDIASTDLPVLTQAIGDEKYAKQLLAAAQKESNPAKKRPASGSASSPDVKRKKSAYELEDEPETPQKLEASLALPELSNLAEEEISKAVVHTNRAPLVLAFAVQLLKYTQPDQPLSSRLSLGQAVVSLNSRTKAVSLGLVKGDAAKEGWGQGQPKVSIMGREVYVLKRSGYEWKEPKQTETGKEITDSLAMGEDQNTLIEGPPAENESTVQKQPGLGISSPNWTVSESVTAKKSTFIARARPINSPAQARQLLRELMTLEPELRKASHNVTAWRVHNNHGGIIEECEDDGETGGGRHILKILQDSNTVDYMLVMTRWYGGILLGSQRWELMAQVCRDALSQRLRVTGIIGQEALWGLDLEGMKESNAPVTGGRAAGMPIHKPEAARTYLLKAFSSSANSAGSTKKKTGTALEQERAHNLALLLAALDILFSSWSKHISREELDRRAWSWYVAVRPETDWGGKGDVKLADILSHRRKW